MSSQDEIQDEIQPGFVMYSEGSCCTQWENYSVTRSAFLKSFRRTRPKCVRPLCGGAVGLMRTRTWRGGITDLPGIRTPHGACERDPETSVSTTLVRGFIVIFVFCLRFWRKAHTCSPLNRISCAITRWRPTQQYTHANSVRRMRRNWSALVIVVVAHVVRVYVPQFHVEFSPGFSYTTISRRFRYAWSARSSAHKNINPKWITVFVCPTSVLGKYSEIHCIKICSIA